MAKTKKATKKKQTTKKPLALTPAQAEEMWKWDDDKILAELGAKSVKNLKKLVKKGPWKTLDEFADEIGPSWEAIREGVEKGQQFPKHPGAFDKMCRILGFSPSEAGKKLGGIYAEQARGEAIDARGAALARLLRMEGVYRRIKDPTDRAIADIAIDALWRQLILLADRQG